MQTDPEIFPIEKLFVNHPRRAVCEGLLASLHPSVRPPDLNFQWKIEGQRILIQSSLWGDIGFLILKDLAPSQVDIQFYSPPFPTPRVTEQVESAIRLEILKNHPTMGDLFNHREEALKSLADELFKYKQTLLIKIRDWLASALGIWGLIQDRSTPDDFSFMIDGTPAQFAVMLRHFFPTLRPIDNVDEVTIVVMKSDSRELQEIPADINPILVNIFSARSRLNIVIHTMPNLHSLLRVGLVGDANSWRLWDVIRDEMARVNWFHLPEVPVQLLEEPSENLSLDSVKPAGDVQEPWLLIPDSGNNRQIVRLWNEHWTCKEISSKVGGTEKTILNRINLLRKQYGPQIVPYRKALPEKKQE